LSFLPCASSTHTSDPHYGNGIGHPTLELYMVFTWRRRRDASPI